MKNKEKYAKEIIEIAKRGHIIAVDKKNKPKDCMDITCEECRLRSYIDETGTFCNTSRKKWFEEEAQKDIYEVIEEKNSANKKIRRSSRNKTRCNKPLREHSNIKKRGVKRWNTTTEQH